MTETNFEDKMAETKTYTVEELLKHTTEEDCWLAIHGKVYNVTDFLDEHPGEN
jgi:cytochrome b involved in lipid metabolism